MKTGRTISTSELKTHVAEVVEQVARKRQPIVITKRGRPVAKIVPVEAETSLFGFARGTISVLGDIVEPVDVDWEAAK